MEIATYTSAWYQVSVNADVLTILLSWFSVFIIIDIYLANSETGYILVSEDAGSTSICVVSRATEELTAFIEDRSYGMFFILDYRLSGSV